MSRQGTGIEPGFQHALRPAMCDRNEGRRIVEAPEDEVDIPAVKRRPAERRPAMPQNMRRAMGELRYRSGSRSQVTADGGTCTSAAAKPPVARRHMGQ